MTEEQIADMREVLTRLGETIGGLDLMARILDASGYTDNLDEPNVAAMLRSWAQECRNVTHE